MARCPEMFRWKGLLEGRAPAEIELRAGEHLEGCKNCQDQVDLLVGRQGAWSDLLQQLRVGQPSGCPTPFHLETFLAGRAPEKGEAKLAKHLEGCERCQRLLEDMLAGRESWSEAVRRLREGKPARGEAFRRVFDELRRRPRPEETSEQTEAPKEPVLTFLNPSNKPGQLGRLGRYEVLELIGRGGFGVVLKALDPSLNRVVAIKVLAPELATGATARRRFTREAQAAAAVTHEHVITIHEVDEANGLPYLVMQYVAGMSLQERIEQGGPLELKEALRIAVQTAAGLAAAHAQGLVHRDIKPANILLENGVQRVKITDFGLARTVDDASLTQSGMIAGTPHYMSPEQARGEEIDHRSDLFSLGSVLYAMCTGRPPFRASSTLAILRRVSDDAPTPVREVNPDVPDWLAKAIERLHAKRPAERFASAAEVANVLGEQLARLQQASWTPPPVPQPPPFPLVVAAGKEEAPHSHSPGAKTSGPITSLTICPSCKSPLQVPENRIGKVVECPQCGKPFRVEDGSQEIQVVRGVKPGIPANSVRKRKLSKVFLTLGGIAVLLLLCCGLPMLVVSSIFLAWDERPHGIAAIHDEFGVPDVGVHDDASRWVEAMSWFPADTTLCGGIDLRDAEPLTLEDPLLRLLLDKALEEDTRPLLVPQRLGEPRVERVSFAYCEDDRRPRHPRFFLRLSGRFDMAKLAEVLRGEVPDAISHDETRGGSVVITVVESPKTHWAFALVGSSEVVIAGQEGPREEGRSGLDLVRQVLAVREASEVSRGRRAGMRATEPGLLSGRLGASVRAISPQACATVIGEVPRFFREGAGNLKLPFAPHLIDLQVKRDAAFVTAELDLSFQKPQDGKEFIESVYRWRTLATDYVAKPPKDVKLTPESARELARTLQTVRTPGTGVNYVMGRTNVQEGHTQQLSGGGAYKPLWNGSWTPDKGPFRVTAKITPEALQALGELLKQLPLPGGVAPATDRK